MYTFIIIIICLERTLLWRNARTSVKPPHLNRIKHTRTLKTKHYINGYYSPAGRNVQYSLTQEQPNVKDW